MLTIFNTNELRHAVEVAKLQGDILENSPAAQELIKNTSEDRNWYLVIPV